MTSEFTIKSRVEIGLTPQVFNNDGVTLRPKLAPNRPYLTVHYTGDPTKWGDPGDTEAEIQLIQRYAQGASKSNEYNYVIGQDDNEFVYEYAGGYQAAHCLGNNSVAVGVLFLNGTTEPPTDKQVRKLQWLREVLKSFTLLAPTVQTLPHKGMPGAATICPGNLIMARWQDIISPYVAPPAPDPNPPPAGGACHTQIQSGDGWWSLCRRIYGSVTPALADALAAFNGNKNLVTGEYIAIPGIHGTQ